MYKLNSIIGIMFGEKMIHMGFGTICSFECPLRGSERVPLIRGKTVHILRQKQRISNLSSGDGASPSQTSHTSKGYVSHRSFHTTSLTCLIFPECQVYKGAGC